MVINRHTETLHNITRQLLFCNSTLKLLSAIKSHPMLSTEALLLYTALYY